MHSEEIGHRVKVEGSTVKDVCIIPKVGICMILFVEMPGPGPLGTRYL